MFAAMLVWLGLIALACSACVRAEPGVEQEPVESAVPSRDAAPKFSSAEIARGSSETGGDTQEPATETDTEADAQTETGREPSELVHARLCSRPFSVSSTPGKGSQTVEQHARESEAERAAARRRLARGFEVQIDARERQAWTTEVGVEFDELDPAAAHTIEIFDADGRRIRRLSLDFERRGSTDLCLGFDAFYGTWQLRTLRSGAKCGPCVTR